MLQGYVGVFLEMSILKIFPTFSLLLDQKWFVTTASSKPDNENGTCKGVVGALVPTGRVDT